MTFKVGTVPNLSTNGQREHFKLEISSNSQYEASKPYILKRILLFVLYFLFMSLFFSLTRLLCPDRTTLTARDNYARDILTDVAICSAVGVVEWMTFYVIGSSLTLFLRSDLGYSTDSASIAYTIWFGSTYMLSVVGGCFSDIYGQTKAITICLVIFAAAIIILAALAFIYDFSSSESLNLTAFEISFWIAMLLQVVGIGGIRATVAAFADSQLHAMDDFFHEPAEIEIIESMEFNEDPTESGVMSFVRRLRKSYWTFFYFEMYLGVIIGVAVSSYLCQVRSICFQIIACNVHVVYSEADFDSVSSHSVSQSHHIHM